MVPVSVIGGLCKHFRDSDFCSFTLPLKSRMSFWPVSLLIVCGPAWSSLKFHVGLNDAIGASITTNIPTIATAHRISQICLKVILKVFLRLYLEGPRSMQSRTSHARLKV